MRTTLRQTLLSRIAGEEGPTPEAWEVRIYLADSSRRIT
jgi:hypothetical protein